MPYRPEPTYRLQVNLPWSLRERLEAYMERTGVQTVKEAIVRLLEAGLEQEESH